MTGHSALELCAGTHVSATGQVGTLFVLGESSIGGGMRRIEAVTGRAAENLFVESAAKLESLSQKLQTPVVDLETRLDSFIRETEELRHRLAALERTALRSEADRMLASVTEVAGVNVLAGRTSATSPESMREMGDYLKAKLSSAVVTLSAVVDGSPMLVTMVTPDLVERGLHAGNLARDTAKVMGGGGRMPARDGPGWWQRRWQAGRSNARRNRIGAPKPFLSCYASWAGGHRRNQNRPHCDS